MLRVVSTHLFLQHRLHPGLLDLAYRGGAQAIEIFAARQHFNYTYHEEITELCDWFRSNPVEPFSMHSPLFPDREMGRSGVPAINVIHAEKARRIAAMDEIKRALEVAERVPLKYLVVHLGEQYDPWSQQTIEHSLTALEHLAAFAKPLGVRILVENLSNEATTPERLMSILEIGHLDTIGVCLDTGHAHMTVGVREAIATFGDRIVSVHTHDNKGTRDEHLWPGEGTIDWPGVAEDLKKLKNPPATVLEINFNLYNPADAKQKIEQSFNRLS